MEDARAAGRPRTGLRLLAASAFVSGAGALVAQVAWVRRLGELFGAGALAAAAVLAFFFLGLGLGGRVFGALADRRGGAIGLVLVLEALAAAAALAFWPAAELADLLHAALLAPEAGLARRLAIQLALSAALVLPAALAMGGQLPALVRHAVRRAPELGPRLASLYGLNTLGAASGAAAAGFVLLPRVGLPVSLAAAAAAHVLAGALAWIGRLREAEGEALDARRAPSARGAPAPRAELGLRARRLLWLAAFLSGALAIGLELVWARALAARLSGTVYAYSAVLVAYLAALGTGGLAAAWLARRGALDGERRALTTLARAWLGLALGTLLSGALLARLPSFELAPGASLSALQARELALSLLVLAPALVCAGLAFPLLVAALARDPARLGRGFGRVGLVNAAGSALGPALLGFGLLPLAGLRVTLVGLALIALAMALALEREARRPAPAGERSRFAVLALAATVVLALAVGDLRRWPSERGGRLLAYREGLAASMAIVEEPGGNRVLALGGDYRLGDLATRFGQARQGMIPLLYAESPRAALHVGLGTGASAGAMLELAAVRGERLALDVVEIVPDLADFALGAFSATNGGLATRLARGEARLFGLDARAFARGARGRYELVVADLFVPWRAGEGAMYTKEQLEAYREALREGGLVWQWLPLYQLDLEGLRTIAAGFLDVFPGGGMCWLYFNAEQPVVALVGGRAPLGAPESELLRERVAGAEAARVLGPLGLVDPLELAASWISDGEPLAAWCASAPRETRAMPRIEFRAPAVRLEDTARRTARVLEAVLELASAAAAEDPRPERRARRLALATVLRALSAASLGRRGEALALARAARELDPAWRFSAHVLEQLSSEGSARAGSPGGG